MATEISMDKMFINFQAMDPIEFGKQVLLKFEIYLRMVAILLAVIVFACVADTGFAYNDKTQGTNICVYNQDAGSCNYAITVGVIAMLSNILFLLIDVAMEVVIQPLVYRIIAICVLLFNMFWAFNWFVLFCLLVNRWNSTPQILKDGLTSLPISNAQAAIAFAFFSILLYIPIIFLGVLRVLRGPGFIGDFEYYQQLFKLKSPYGKFDEPESGGDAYQAPREETY